MLGPHPENKKKNTTPTPPLSKFVEETFQKKIVEEILKDLSDLCNLDSASKVIALFSLIHIFSMISDEL